MSQTSKYESTKPGPITSVGELVVTGLVFSVYGFLWVGDMLLTKVIGEAKEFSPPEPEKWHRHK